MSKNETPLIRKYWQQVGGVLIEEFPVVRRTTHNGPRYIDAVIIPGEETKITRANEISLEGKDIICIQAKRGRLGMYLMGQALFSRQMLERFKPRNTLSVALCTKDDSVLRPLLEKYDNIRVIIINPD
jgi:hypothetical protein